MKKQQTKEKKEFEFEPKRILKHKNHVTLNEGEQMNETVQHLEKKGDEFVELKKNEVARKYGSKKLVRELDFNNRDGLKLGESGLGKTPDWFQHIIPTINWEKHRTFLYEIDHLWMNMFFVRELYAEEKTGREQILQLNKAGEGLKLEVLCQLDYISDENYQDYNKDLVDGFIKVQIVSEDKQRSGEEGREYDIDVEFKHTYFSDEDEHVASGLREILTGIALKHGHRDEQLVFSISEEDGEWQADILNKDFTVRFGGEKFLDESVSPWVREMFYWDGCPLQTEVNE